MGNFDELSFSSKFPFNYMDILFLTYPLSALLILVISVLLGIALTRRFKLSWRLWWIGAITFVLSQVGHIPFNILLTDLFQRGVLPAPAPAYHLIFNSLILGLSAGLWEESTRLLVYHFWAKDARSWRKALLMGAGHGGSEAILFVALPILLTFISMVSLLGVDIPTAFPADQVPLVQEQIRAYWSIDWTFNLMAVLERVFALVAHMTFSVLILQVFTRGQIRWYFAALLWHSLWNAIILYTAGTLGIYASEALAFLTTLTNIGIIYFLHQPEPPTPDEIPADLPPISPVRVPQLSESEENLDRSRFL